MGQSSLRMAAIWRRAAHLIPPSGPVQDVGDAVLGGRGVCNPHSLERLRIGNAFSAYGHENYTRLARLKVRYDPSNLFRLNRNIEPKQ